MAFPGLAAAIEHLEENTPGMYDGKPKWPGVPESAYSASGHSNKRHVRDSGLGRIRAAKAGSRFTDETWAEFLRLPGQALISNSGV